MIKGKKIGIPVTEVGDRIKKLNEILEANDMTLKAESDVNVCFYKGVDTAISLKLEVVLLGEGEDKANG